VPVHARHLVAAVALLTAFVAPLGAQQAPLREGTLVEAGFGGGWAGAGCRGEGCMFQNENGWSGYVQVGHPITQEFTLGAEYSRWSKAQYGGHGHFDLYTAVVQWYPESGRFFWKGGAGYGRTRYVQSLVDAAAIEQDGLVYQIGIGYDMPVSRRVALTPYVKIASTLQGAARVEGVQRQGKFSSNILQYGFAIGLH
jgi:hypothetical protein